MKINRKQHGKVFFLHSKVSFLHSQVFFLHAKSFFCTQKTAPSRHVSCQRGCERGGGGGGGHSTVGDRTKDRINSTMMGGGGR